ncbi:endonuclease domain-containing protein [Microbacterium gorillae]|uniref:endonuclease domain-containing protein n=1 Tax=Microbacterium gorillae TaxID=1231063 RepID=UPI003D9832B4
MARGQLIESVEDTLQHVALCCDLTTATVIWESACRVEGVSPETLHQIAWTSTAARLLAATVTGLSDSGLETLLIRGLAHLNCELRAQAFVAGHRVDLLIGDRLVLQVDGQEFHSSAAERTRDAAHDAELTLRGYTVLRFTYAQVIHDWPRVLATVSRAVAQRRHLLPR